MVAIILAAAIYYGVVRSKAPPPAKLETSAVTRGDLLESIASTGTLSATQEVIVGSQVSGIITKVLVDYNDDVKAGQLLAVVDPQTLQAQVDVARATLAQRRVSYEEAARQLADGKPLLEKGYLSNQDMRALEVAARNTKAQLDSAQVDFNKQSVQLKYAEIRSPIDGVVMTRSVDPGNTVQASMQAPTLFVVASDLRKMKILANVDETQIATIKQGMRARFTVSGIANKTFNAVVNQIRLKSTTVNNVVTYIVVLDAENPDKLLFPGMTATIDFILSNLENKLLVPNGALRMRIPDELRAEQTSPAAPGTGDAGARRPSGAAANRDASRGAVWKVNAQGKAYRVPVRVLASDLTTSAVEPVRDDLLQEGDPVITRVIDANPATGAASSGQGNRTMSGGAPGFGPGGFGGGR